MDNIQPVKTDNEVHSQGSISHRKIENTMFKVVSYYSTDRTYEDIAKNAIIREIKRNY